MSKVKKIENEALLLSKDFETAQKIVEIVPYFVLFVKSVIRIEIVGHCLGWCSPSEKSCFKVCFFQMRRGPMLPSNSKSSTGRYKDV